MATVHIPAAEVEIAADVRAKFWRDEMDSLREEWIGKRLEVPVRYGFLWRHERPRTREEAEHDYRTHPEYGWSAETAHCLWREQREARCRRIAEAAQKARTSGHVALSDEEVRLIFGKKPARKEVDAE